MSHNKKMFRQMVEESKQKKTIRKPKDRIVDPMGQLNYPGEVTRIPSNRITMQGVPYPVLGVGSNGQQQMMFPGQEYNFGSASYVDEYPMMKAQYGGGFTYLEPTSRKLPTNNDRSELATSIGGENGEPAFLVPSFKYGRPILGPSNDPYLEFLRTREHLGGPFKTWQEADAWDRNVRHPYVEKGQAIPTPIRRWGKDYTNQSSGEMPYRFFRDGGFSTTAQTTTPFVSTQTEDEINFQKFFKTLPFNLRVDSPDYNLRGYWKALGSPEKFDYSQPKEDDGFYHAFSRNPQTGEILKKPWHPTFKMAIEGDRKAGYYPIGTPEGKVKTVSGRDFKMGGDISIPNLEEGNWLDKYAEGGLTTTETTRPPIYTKDPRKVAAYQDSLNLYNLTQGAINIIRNTDINSRDDFNRISPILDRVPLSYNGINPTGWIYEGTSSRNWNNAPYPFLAGIPNYTQPVQEYIFDQDIYLQPRQKKPTLPEKLNLPPARNIELKSRNPFSTEKIKITKPPTLQPKSTGKYILTFGESPTYEGGTYVPRKLYFDTRKEADDMMNFLQKENDRRYDTGVYYNNLSTSGNVNFNPGFKKGGETNWLDTYDNDEELEKFATGGFRTTTLTTQPESRVISENEKALLDQWANQSKPTKPVTNPKGKDRGVYWDAKEGSWKYRNFWTGDEYSYFSTPTMEGSTRPQGWTKDVVVTGTRPSQIQEPNIEDYYIYDNNGTPIGFDQEGWQRDKYNRSVTTINSDQLYTQASAQDINASKNDNTINTLTSPAIVEQKRQERLAYQKQKQREEQERKLAIDLASIPQWAWETSEETRARADRAADNRRLVGDNTLIVNQRPFYNPITKKFEIKPYDDRRRWFYPDLEGNLDASWGNLLPLGIMGVATAPLWLPPLITGASAALTAPLTIGSSVYPSVTAGNILTAAGIANSAINATSNIAKGNYLDAATDIGWGALDVYGLNPSLLKNTGAAFNKAGNFIKNAPSSKVIFQTPKARLNNPTAYDILTSEKPIGFRNKVVTNRYNKTQNQLSKQINKAEDAVFNYENQGNQDLAKLAMSERDELWKQWHRNRNKYNKWKLGYSGLPLEHTGLAGGQGQIYKNLLNENEYVKLGDYFGNEESFQNLVDIGRKFQSDDVVAAFPTRGVPYGNKTKEVSPNFKIAQFMPKLQFESSLGKDLTTNVLKDQDKIRKTIQELEDLGVGIDYTGIGNVGRVGNKLGLVDLAYIGTKNNPINAGQYEYLRNLIYKPQLPIDLRLQQRNSWWLNQQKLGGLTTWLDRYEDGGQIKKFATGGFRTTPTTTKPAYLARLEAQTGAMISDLRNQAKNIPNYNLATGIPKGEQYNYANRDRYFGSYPSTVVTNQEPVSTNVDYEDVNRRGDIAYENRVTPYQIKLRTEGANYVNRVNALNRAGTISMPSPKPSWLDRSLDILSHPTEAFGYVVQGRDLPTRMGGNNLYDLVFGFPGQVLKSGKNLLEAAVHPIDTGIALGAGATNLFTNLTTGENLFDEKYNNKALGLGLDFLNIAGANVLKNDLLRLYDRNFNKVGSQLANIEREGLARGLDAGQIRTNQLLATKTLPEMRNPTASFYRDITPQSLINKVKASKNPLINTIPNLFTDPVSSGIKSRYLSALGWSAANQTGNVVNKVFPKLYKDLAYKVMSTGAEPQRKARDVLNAIFRNKGVGNYTGVIGGDAVVNNFGLKGRNLLRNYIYGDAQGFDLSDIERIGLDDYIKQYGNLNTYKLLTNDYLNNNPFTNVREVTNDFLSKKSFTDYFKQSYPELYDDLIKINPNFANQPSDMIYAWNKRIDPSTTEAIFKDYLSKNKSIKVGRQFDPTYTYDNIAGHQLIYSLDPQTNQLMRQTQDLWKFTPSKYSKRWSSGAGRDAQLITANDRLNELKAYSQSQLVDRSGKPFILQDKRPISFSSSNSSVNKDIPGLGRKPASAGVKFSDLFDEVPDALKPLDVTKPFLDVIKPLDLKSISSRASKLTNKKTGGEINKWLNNL